MEKNLDLENAAEMAHPPSGDRRLSYFERQLVEAFDELWDSFVDPADAFYDVDGERWSAVGGRAGGGAGGAPFSTEQELAEIRNYCRALATSNEFAINGHDSLLRKLPIRCVAVTPHGQSVYCASRKVPTIAEPPQSGNE